MDDSLSTTSVSSCVSCLVEKQHPAAAGSIFHIDLTVNIHKNTPPLDRG